MTPTGADRHPWPKLNPSLRHYIPAALTPDLLSPRYPPHQPTRPPCLTNFYQRDEFKAGKTHILIQAKVFAFEDMVLQEIISEEKKRNDQYVEFRPCTNYVFPKLTTRVIIDPDQSFHSHTQPQTFSAISCDDPICSLLMLYLYLPCYLCDYLCSNFHLSLWTHLPRCMATKPASWTVMRSRNLGNCSR